MHAGLLRSRSDKASSMGPLMATLMTLAWSVHNSPPGGAVSLHSLAAGRARPPTGPFRSSGGGQMFPSSMEARGNSRGARYPMPSKPWERLRGGGFVNKEEVRENVVATSLLQKLKGAFKGWLRNEARDPLAILVSILVNIAPVFCARVILQEVKNVSQGVDTLANGVDTLANQMHQRGLDLAEVLFLPDPDRTDYFFVQVVMGKACGLPPLLPEHFYLKVLVDQAHKLALVYANGALKTLWTLDIPAGIIVDASVLARRWSFTVEESDTSPVVRLAPRNPFKTATAPPREV